MLFSQYIALTFLFLYIRNWSVRYWGCKSQNFKKLEDCISPTLRNWSVRISRNWIIGVAEMHYFRMHSSPVVLKVIPVYSFIRNWHMRNWGTVSYILLSHVNRDGLSHSISDIDRNMYNEVSLPIISFQYSKSALSLTWCYEIGMDRFQCQYLFDIDLKFGI